MHRNTSWRAWRPALAIACAFGIATLADPTTARADDTAEAAALFASGNQHLQAATRLRGERRTRELEAALADYFSSLRIVRSRNVLFNTSLALEMLGRNEESFNYMVEYLGVPGLTETERAEGTRRLEALRPNVAVLSIRSAPAGAEVWIDRRDLASRGRTPLQFALPPGEHQIWLRAPGHREAQVRATASTGSTRTVEVTLTPEPVRLQVLAPADLRLTLDGQPIEAGANVEVLPGAHVVRLEVEGGSPIERRFEVLAGAAPMTIDLTPAVSGLVRHSDAVLRVASTVASQVLIDGTVVGFGPRVEVPVPLGEHEITVRADGYEPFVARRTFTAGTQSALEVDLRPTPRGGALFAPRIVLGVAGVLGLLGGVGLTVAAIETREDFEWCTTQALSDCVQRADRAEALNLAGDVTWIATAAIGLTALVLLFVDDTPAAEPSVGTFSLAPLPGGAALSWSIPLRGVL